MYGPKFLSAFTFVDPNFRHLRKFSSLRADIFWTNKVAEIGSSKVAQIFIGLNQLWLISTPSYDETFILTLSFIILKNDQAYFKNLVVFIVQNYEWNG